MIVLTLITFLLMALMAAFVAINCYALLSIFLKSVFADKDLRVGISVIIGLIGGWYGLPLIGGLPTAFLFSAVTGISWTGIRLLSHRSILDQAGNDGIAMTIKDYFRISVIYFKNILIFLGIAFLVWILIKQINVPSLF
ncbi:MAG: hypothetical protein EOO45_03920 [Flavobacterium sp.]|nr:MAG: hypothetical protein EOO45_03920 [Flavobacterium sp.]